ncbi:DUF3094 domain-containing protein [Sansalvadorimonas sp. 2012CJ34-2]|uniref:DUF3094 domain-containing protein n=1 Tax=Parendozoicomonas callyspongiae TaxID=2942213 RepID=A0ABT0PC40_9GAMM|nr:DUF3094 family protein [Sansalvadorimonas sp. 2012CJ34-2]MCL6268953.1 DUF3094 domain-containing protein [Sansalvadorimonas sp. 2012CJ34-2]
MNKETEQQTRLNPEDQQLVDDFISSGINKEERQPFHPWKLMMWLAVVIVIFGVLARVVGTLYLPY